MPNEGISIVIPTKNRLNDLKRCIESLIPQLSSMDEIIVIDKSSEEYKRRMKKKGIFLISQKTRGYENTLMEAFSEAHGKILSTIDADGTYKPEDLKRAIETLVKGNFDMVLGNRINEHNKNVMGSYISFGNKNLTSIYNKTHKAKLHDVLSGIFVMHRKAFESIRTIKPYRAGTLFFIMEISKKGYDNIVDIPISYLERPNNSVSKLAKSKLLYGAGVALHIVRAARDYNPLAIFGAIGVLLILAGLILGAFVIGSYLASGTLTEIGRALIAFMLVTFGFLSLILGLILDLLLQISKNLEHDH